MLVFFLAFFLDFFELAFIIVPLLAPVAQTLGIDLIWFGVILAVNMQTSFMHPPFGFALFYLRSVAPRTPYVDKVTKRTMPPVTSGQIYWGAVPFVVIQLFDGRAAHRLPTTGAARCGAQPWRNRSSRAAARAGEGAFKNRGFSLSPYPPAIPGAPPPITTGPGAPTLDMSTAAPHREVVSLDDVARPLIWKLERHFTGPNAGAKQMFVGHYGVSFADKPTTESKCRFGFGSSRAMAGCDLVRHGANGDLMKLRIVPGFTEAKALDLYYMPYTHSLPGSIFLSFSMARQSRYIATACNIWPSRGGRPVLHPGLACRISRSAL